VPKQEKRCPSGAKFDHPEKIVVRDMILRTAKKRGGGETWGKDAWQLEMVPPYAPTNRFWKELQKRPKSRDTNVGKPERRFWRTLTKKG